MSTVYVYTRMNFLLLYDTEFIINEKNIQEIYPSIIIYLNFALSANLNVNNN